MVRFAGQGKNKKAEEALKLIKRRARDSFSTPGDVFLRYASYRVPEDEKKKRDEAFLYGTKMGKYKYVTLEQLPCGDMFRNKHHIQYDPTADWHVPVSDVYYVSRKKVDDRKKKPPPVPMKPKVVPPKLKEVLQMRPRRTTDRRKSTNPRGIYERPPMNPDPKGMYNGFGRKPTFVPPQKPPVVESSTRCEDEEDEDEHAPIKMRIKDIFKGHCPRKQSVFMALKLEDFQKPRRQSFTEPPTPPATPPESSSSSESEPKSQKWVRRRVEDKLHSHSESASSRRSIFIKWERTLEDDEDPQSREPMFEYGSTLDSADTPKKRVKASYEKYAICHRKHHVVANVCLACEKDETYGLFTETLKTEPWKLPRGRPDPRYMNVVCSPADEMRRDGVPHSQLPVCYMFDHEVDHTYHAKKAARIDDEKAKMRKHLSDTLRKYHCHLYKPVNDPAAAIAKPTYANTQPATAPAATRPALNDEATKPGPADATSKSASHDYYRKPAVFNPANVCNYTGLS